MKKDRRRSIRGWIFGGSVALHAAFAVAAVLIPKPERAETAAIELADIKKLKKEPPKPPPPPPPPPAQEKPKPPPPPKAQAQAKALEDKRDAAVERSEKFEVEHGRLTIASTLLHMAIAIATLAIILHRRWPWLTALALSAGGLAAAAWAYL